MGAMEGAVAIGVGGIRVVVSNSPTRVSRSASLRAVRRAEKQEIAAESTTAATKRGGKRVRSCESIY